ncbi:MAG: HAD-IC family P-type ATPase [Candidatus Thiothrix singaporensis]|uniref:HAD-IC family P-type ATPase n=1 Tax=Candidatus Thiothrix singaporensis TaxID=2799669 RepID=A0A7L6AQU8_9GAMM|nr:MAG: HAD-IC family P-type ATPase [Candidatus Thiothrix singaporensis]
MNYMHIASRSGVLIRDGRALEKLAKVDLVVFDKTGTLTSAVPTVHRVTAIGGFDALSVLRLAATAERQQSHPLAYAILQAAEASGINAATLDTMKVRPGFGLHVRIDGRDVLVGSERLLTSEGVSIGGYTRDAAPEDIVVYVAVDGELAGFIELAPSIRPEAAAVVKALQATGVEVVVLSGDREAPPGSGGNPATGWLLRRSPAAGKGAFHRASASVRTQRLLYRRWHQRRSGAAHRRCRRFPERRGQHCRKCGLHPVAGRRPGQFARPVQSGAEQRAHHQTLHRHYDSGWGRLNGGRIPAGYGGRPAMALNVLVIGGCMLNATSPLLKNLLRSGKSCRRRAWLTRGLGSNRLSCGIIPAARR